MLNITLQKLHCKPEIMVCIELYKSYYNNGDNLNLKIKYIKT